MPSVNFKLNGLPVHMDFAGNCKPGDQPPSGYMDWHSWAEVQHKAGLRQKQCGRCGKWKYPQELSDVIDVSYPTKGKHGPKVRHESPVCNKCR